MRNVLRQKLELMTERLQLLRDKLIEPDTVNDRNLYRSLTREHSETEPLVEAYHTYLQCERDEHTADQLKRDPEMREFAEEELQLIKDKKEQLEHDLQKALIPRDPDDDRDIVLEIRAGTGGDESALFAAELFRMYLRYAERQRWQIEIISESPSDLGGYKEVIARMEGDGVYGHLKFESGAHRVQRVPATETQGRIHTSACTVAVMPEADPVKDININPADLRIDTFRASGAGGQHINKTDSAIRITHLPSGLVVECQDGRSQHKNKAQALSVLATRLRDKERYAREAKEAAERRSLVGTGDRSERIRTYNFPQGRITDHRINYTAYKIEAMMDGDIQELLDALKNADYADQLSQLLDE
jgi:peptide chain release factor 1